MSARRRLGQHFLVDPSIVERILAALAPREGEAVVEIGPGKGALTAGLIRAAGRIAAIELDARLAAELRSRFAPERLVLVEGDVLGVEPEALLAALDRASDARLVLAGNLPYSISKPIAQKLIRDRARIDRAVLMFQREVAQRLTAAPGGRDYGPLGILAGQCYEIRKLFDLPPAAFRPRPRVDSTLTLWRPRAEPGLGAEEQARLRACLAACFAQRRRTLRNNLRAVLPGERATDALLEAAGLDGAARAETIAPAGFLSLCAAWDFGVPRRAGAATPL